jgi:hypothetical protein
MPGNGRPQMRMLRMTMTIGMCMPGFNLMDEVQKINLKTI